MEKYKKELENTNNPNNNKMKSPLKISENKYKPSLGNNRSISLVNIKNYKQKKIKEEENKEKNNFYSSGKNFYKLFNDSERKAISLLFKNSEEDLKNFKQKIETIENRNVNSEKILKNDNKELSKQNLDKDKKIKNFNDKIRDNERKIKEMQEQLENQKNINFNLEKKLRNQVESMKKNQEIIRKKDEEIKKIKEQNLKMSNMLEQMKDDIQKVNIEKNKEKELEEFKNEIGTIEIIDVNKILNITKKFSSENLTVQKAKEHFYNPKKNWNYIENDGFQEKNDVSTKKRKKKKNETKKEGENIKLCKKIKKEGK